MSDEENVILCAGCGRDLSDTYDPIDPHKRIPCPDCGSTLRNHFSTIKFGIRYSMSVESKVRDPSGFVKQESKTWEGRSDKSDRPVTISKDIDRTKPNYTEFHHKVEELDEHGILKRTVHEHTNREKAKHRPEKGNDNKNSNFKTTN